eukprot:3718356-Prymnesium_polylepis.1
MPDTPPGFDAGVPAGVGSPSAEACAPPVGRDGPPEAGAAARRKLTLPVTPPALRCPKRGRPTQLVQVNAAADRVDTLCEASSRLPGRYAPRPADASSWRDTLRYMLRLQQRAAPCSTLKQENSNLKHWRAFCEHQNTDVIRPSVYMIAMYGDDAVVAEQLFWAAALPFILNRMSEA